MKEVAAQTKNIWGAVRYLKHIVAIKAPHLPRNADTAGEKKLRKASRSDSDDKART
jgi:hypothetical protein